MLKKIVHLGGISAALVATVFYSVQPGSLFRFRHFWAWVKSDRNAEGLGALASIVTTIVGTLAFAYAAKVYRATAKQVDIARRQANAAQRPFLLLDQKAFLDRQRRIKTLLIIRNNGSGPVTDSYWSRAPSKAMSPASDQTWVRVGSISKRGTALLKLADGTRFASMISDADSILIHYRDLEGNRYYCTASSHKFGIDNDNDALPPDVASPLDRPR